MKRSDLYTPQRQSIYAIIIILLRFLRTMIRQFWPILLILFFNRGGDTSMWIAIAAAMFGGISLIGSIIAYYRFFFYIHGDQLHIDQGVLRLTHLQIPFERIQTIDFEQNIIHQFFNVVRVKIDSAGTKGSEISFDALDKERAHLLREFILAHKAKHAPEHAAGGESRPEELILRLTPGDLLRIGVSQNHFRTAGIIFAGAIALLDAMSDFVGETMFDMVEDEAKALISGSLVLVLIAIPVFLVFAFIITLIRTIIVYYDLRFLRTTNGFKLIAGLFVRKEKSAQKDKIQLIAWDTNPVKRIFGIYRLRLYQASSVEVIGDKSISVPGCVKEQVDRTIDQVIPGSLDVAYETHGIHPLARFRFFLFAGVLPCVLVTVAGYLIGYTTAFWVWLYLPVSAWMSVLYHHKRKLHMHRDYTISSTGIFGDQHKIGEIYKIQAVRLSQSFYQWRKDLATVTMYTASGDISIPFIPVAKAQQMRDYLLYRIEIDKRDWM